MPSNTRVERLGDGGVRYKKCRLVACRGGVGSGNKRRLVPTDVLDHQPGIPVAIVHERFNERRGGHGLIVAVVRRE